MKEEKKSHKAKLWRSIIRIRKKKMKKIVVLDADLAGTTKTGIFAKEYPERFFDMGIAEQDMMSTAAGLATCGKIPYASTFAIFAAGKSV